MSIFKVTRETKILLIGVAIISTISFVIAYFYYSGINKSEDPRIIDSKFMFSRYDQLLIEKNYNDAFLVLDSIEHILINTPGYSDSYELGIVFNNRSSIFISRALYETNDSTEKQYLLDTALLLTNNCIDFYSKWINRFGKLNEKEILIEVIPFFEENDKTFNKNDYKKILSKRVKDIILAQKETPRRLSVTYTNLGIIQRHQYKHKEAIESYLKAIKMWKDNPAALSNLNVLYGKPPKDRTIIQKLFPPDRNE